MATTDPIQAAELESVMLFLDRPDVGALFARSAQRAITREGLETIPLPAGLTFRQTETLLAAVNRLKAVRAPLPDCDGHTYWYTTTDELMLLLRAIDRHCTEGSQIDRAISDPDGRRVLVRSLVEEAIATGRLDGVDIGDKQARELLRLGKTPGSDDERVVANIHHVLGELPRLAHAEVTSPFLIDLYERLTEGTETPRFDGSVEFGESALRMTRLDVLERLSQIAGDEQRSLSEHPSITGLTMLWDIQYWQPFPRCNGAIARIVFKLHALKNGYPVLGFLPISSVAAWDEDEPIGTATAVTTIERYSEVDMTGYLTARLRLLGEELDKLVSDIAKVQDRDETLRWLLRGDRTLNGRQRSILGRALRVPDATFRIRYHQSVHEIAYSTARTDLLGLEEAGYLRQEQEGKAFVFVAAEGLSEKVDRCSLPNLDSCSVTPGAGPRCR